MKRSILMVVMAAMCMTMFTGCGKYVSPGYVGVVVNKWGSDKGVQTDEVGQGWTWTGIRKSIVTFPTFKQNYVWTVSKDEGSPNDESIYFNTKDGLDVSMDIGISYAIVPDKADQLYAEYRLGIDEITDRYIRNIVRDEVNTASAKYTCEDIYGTKKGDFIGEIQSNVVIRCAAKGLNVESVYLIGRIRIPKPVQDAISAKIAAIQLAQTRENEIVEATANAQKVRAAAEGEADAYTSRENAKLDIMSKQAQILKENPQLIQWKALEIWNGELPKFTGGGAIPFINVDAQSTK